MRERLDWGYTLAEAFGPAWEDALELVPLEDEDQGLAYRQLIAWARSDELFTSTTERALA